MKPGGYSGTRRVNPATIVVHESYLARAFETVTVATPCPCGSRDCPRTTPLEALRSDLDQPHEPPTVSHPAELPDQLGPRYPLAHVERQSMTLLALVVYLFRLWAWRYWYGAPAPDRNRRP